MIFFNYLFNFGEVFLVCIFVMMLDIKILFFDNFSVNDEFMLFVFVLYEDSNVLEFFFSFIIIGLYGILGVGKFFFFYYMNENFDL